MSFERMTGQNESSVTAGLSNSNKTGLCIKFWDCSKMEFFARMTKSFYKRKKGTHLNFKLCPSADPSKSPYFIVYKRKFVALICTAKESPSQCFSDVRIKPLPIVIFLLLGCCSKHTSIFLLR